MSSQLWWYVARASGVVAWLLLTASVLWGIVLSTKAFPEQRRPAWLLDLHRWLGGLTVSFVAIHLLALVADSYTTFTIADLAIPYASDWKPGAVALGVVAAWSLVAVEATSLAMRRLPRRVWRGIHLVSYLTFWLTSLHAAFAGTDRTQVLYQATAAASVALVGWAVVYRLTHQKPVRRGRSAAAERVATAVPATADETAGVDARGTDDTTSTDLRPGSGDREVATAPSYQSTSGTAGKS
jgi:DMSO/TMAO reductase YedYZ heme-binding membrane subunit